MSSTHCLYQTCSVGMCAMITNNLPSNWAIFSQRLKFLPITASNCGWCISVVNHRFTFWNGWRNCSSSTWKNYQIIIKFIIKWKLGTSAKPMTTGHTSLQLLESLQSLHVWIKNKFLYCCRSLFCVHVYFSVLWRCRLDSRKGIRHVKNSLVGCWRSNMGQGADLHMTQLMTLPLTVSCSRKSRLVYLSRTSSPR